MYHEQLVTHILHKRSLHFSDEAIRKELLEDDWSKQDIDLGFYYADHPEKMKSFSFKKMFTSEVRFSSFILLFFFAVVATVSVFIYSSGKIINYNLVAPLVPGTTTPALTYGESEALSHPDFFNQVKNEFIDSKATFVEVDLTQMTARVYKDGAMLFEVPVKTKGRMGSWWETPAGLYKIETKEKTHYSSMGHVTQPWSMEFQGNFFIHGIPYYDDGTPVATSFSGGCIRLENDDAKKIYDAVTIGTPILVYEKDFLADSFTYTDNTPDISAQSYLYADINNNFVFLKNNETESIPARSITKLMTALVATEYINIEKTITIPSSALVETSTPRLKAGMNIDIYQLLFPLLRESSNEAGEAIARSYGRDLFIEHMNEKAQAIGMTHTTFVDPTGTSDKNTTTAEDMFMLAKYIYNNRSFIFNITSGKVKTNTYGESIFNDLGNVDSLSNDPSFFGGIADEDTKDNEYNLSVFELQTGSTTRPVFFASLLSHDAAGDIKKGMQYLMERYK